MKVYSLTVVSSHTDWSPTLQVQLDSSDLFFPISFYQDGQAALAYISAHRPDVVMTGLILPGMDGLSLISHIRRDIVGYDPRIYVLSELNTPHIIRIMAQLRVDLYSLRPVEPEEAMECLHRLVTGCEGGMGSSDPDRYLVELGAAPDRISTRCVSAALLICMDEPEQIHHLSTLYRTTASRLPFQASHTTVERNIRSAIRSFQKNPQPLFQSLFPYSKVTNGDFLARSVSFLQHRMLNSGIE